MYPSSPSEGAAVSSRKVNDGGKDLSSLQLFFDRMRTAESEVAIHPLRVAPIRGVIIHAGVDYVAIRAGSLVLLVKFICSYRNKNGLLNPFSL